MPRTRSNSLEVYDLINRIDLDRNRNPKGVNSGTPLFTIDDLRTTYHPLTKLIRGFCVIQGITRESFEIAHRKTAFRSYLSVNAINYERNNMRRSLQQPEMTYNFAEKFLTTLGWNREDLAITVTNHETGEVVTVSTKEIDELIRKNTHTPKVYLQSVNSVMDNEAQLPAPINNHEVKALPVNTNASVASLIPALPEAQATTDAK